MNLTILGAGAWGTALSVHASSAHSTHLWARDPTQVAHMQSMRRNARYLPEVPLPRALRVTADLDAAIAHARGGLVLVATPMAGLADLLRRLSGHAMGVLWLCKGFEEGTGWLGHEVARVSSPRARVGVISGPSFALEVARGLPTALVAASDDDALADAAVAALHHGHVRVYTSGDPIGVEVGGAVKNVLAIATGISDGLGLGLNARAALITRGLAEMTRLGVALGARPDTFMGLSGLGDLVLTATGDLSRNRTVGLRLAQGQPLGSILGDLGHVAEGVRSAPLVLRRAHAKAIDMPIVESVAAVLDGALVPSEALERLMARDARPEA
ncbi:MAG TPA: NAD(P)H-dependent glycerol-3-phosphate dehydrogenase [Caldimonas sp.]|nr:NAD(P)H-dependent glycerol-3-phosphate dehydrogenase [Caldimonas sp.]